MVIANVFSPVVRAVLVIGAVAAVVTGITFAALTSEATLTENSLDSETAALRVNNMVDGNFNVSEEGFAFLGVVPGTPSTSGHNFQVKNVSEAAVDVNVRLTSTVGLPSGVLPGDITFTFDPTSPEGTTETSTWGELATENGELLLTGLAAAGVQTYTVTVDVSGGVGASEVDISSFDLIFGVPPSL